MGVFLSDPALLPPPPVDGWSPREPLPAGAYGRGVATTADSAARARLRFSMAGATVSADERRRVLGRFR